MTISAQNARLSVHSFPSGAKVFLDGGYYIGQTPLVNRAISPGNHKITLVLENYDKQAEDIYISPGKSLNLYFNLAPIFGKLKLTSEPEGAVVYINNNEYVGITPLTIHLGLGIYLLELIKPNYHKWSKVVTVYDDQTISIRAKLDPILEPPDPDCSTLIDKGKNYYTNGLCAEAVMFLRKTIQVCPNSYSWEAYYYLGESYLGLKLNNEAIEAFKSSINLNPKYKSYRGLGYVYNEIKLYDQAIDAYLKAINLNPESDLLYTLIGIAYNNAGHTSEAIKYHKKAISRNPKDTASYGYLGDIYLQSGLFY
jgi:tetratricopeptide (TPR) repeat protein